jgi:hypothetical protein
MKSVIAPLVGDKKDDENTAGYAYGQAGNIDQRSAFVFPDIS